MIIVIYLILARVCIGNIRLGTGFKARAPQLDARPSCRREFRSGLSSQGDGRQCWQRSVISQKSSTGGYFQ